MSATLKSTPRADGFHMPADFEPHAGCWMLWPERPDNWRLGAVPAQAAYAAVASTIAQFEPVSVGVSHAQFENARHLLPSQVRLVELSADDAWMRDCGPTFVTNHRGELRGVDWAFNAWGGLQGGLYFPWDKDCLVAQKVLEIERLDRYQVPGFVLEGGSIYVDGEGTLLTTEECLLNPNRNPNLTKTDIENILMEYLNVQKIIWLERGVANDETSGHVDNLCCFVRPGVVALTWCDDPTDPQYSLSRAAYERLIHSVDAHNHPFEVHLIHQPNPITISKEESLGIAWSATSKPRQAGDRLPASYINFYIANQGVVVPTFDDPHDQPALEELQRLFPKRQVVGVPAREILLGGGGIHCITLGQPLP